ncbi:MAG: energy transducer TonB [Chthoniobacterales bacterium]|nr:energy transducer TonB [Chthoniobacterales bacterium]
MAGPLLYQPPPRWQVWAAIGGAVLLHCAAVAIASIHPVVPAVDTSAIPEAVEVTLEQPQEPTPPEPTPPPEEPDLPPPPPQEVQPEFREEQPTPPPKQKPPSNKPPPPIARPKPAGPAGPVSTNAKANALFLSKPSYPYEARKQKLTGSGVVLLSVDSGGNCTDASMGQSTGSPILDSAATTALRRSRFKVGTPPQVKVPITFTMNGVSL